MTPADRGFDPRSFTLRNMTELGSNLRRLGDGATSMDQVADRLVRHLYEHLIDFDSGERSCALVRFFKTQRYSDLDPDLQRFAQELLPGGEAPRRMRCLTLLASAGDEPEWNTARDSTAHRAIPLVSEEMVSQAPMIARLLQQLGVQIDVLLDSVVNSGALLVNQQPTSFNVFYVPDARDSPYIPAQEEFPYLNFSYHSRINCQFFLSVHLEEGVQLFLVIGANGTNPCADCCTGKIEILTGVPGIDGDHFMSYDAIAPF